MVGNRHGLVLIAREGCRCSIAFLGRWCCRAVLLARLGSAAGAADLAGTTNAINVSTNRIIALKSLTLEDLLHADVTTVSKSPEDMFGAAAAVFVITGDDIRRSGALNIPEALEMAPGLQVAQINQNSWAISARGFNAFNADKLLVMVDGRTVYSPVFDGVFWNTTREGGAR